MTREAMKYDVVIVGAGPSGLATGIKLKQLNSNLNVCILEKGAEVGAHILSGNIFETKALDELLPNWKEEGAPVKIKVSKEKFLFLGKNKCLSWPTWLLPSVQKNHNNYIISLANLCRWLAEQAEKLGVEIFPGFPASEVLYNEDGSVKGVSTVDMGLDKDGNKKDTYEQGIELHAKVTVFAEGCRGHLGKHLIKKYQLDQGKDPQQYGIGLKEIWEISENQHQQGLVMHTVGWPLDKKTYGGSFVYHAEKKQIYIGYVIGLDYQNPHLSPFEEFQRFKTHPVIRKILEGGKRISYGARALIEGGIQSLPKMFMSGALLIGCDAGTLNMPKIKGSHTAMKSGIIAAETIVEHIKNKGTVYAVDPNSKMMEIAKKKLAKYNNIKWYLGSAEKLSFKDNYFNYYSISFGLRNTNNINRVLQEAYRVLKPGGRFICLEFSKIKNYNFKKLYDFYSKSIPKIGNIVIGDDQPYEYLVKSIKNFYNQRELIDLMKKNNFYKSEYRSLSGGIVAIHSGWKI